jgi:hypothetical protein
MAYGTCKICGCTDVTACYHPDFGPCWWVDASHEICSHCVELKDDPKVQRKRNESMKFSPEQKLMALSWKQPYAELMLHGKIETRTWFSHYTGWVLICTSKVPYKVQQVFDIAGEKQFPRILNILGSEFCKTFIPMNGYAIAVGKLVGSRIMQPEDEDKCFVQYGDRKWCHIYKDVMQIEPIPWKGCQGWKEVSPEIKRLIRFK